MFDYKRFMEFVIQNNVIQFFEEPIELKSGKMSNYYVNWRNAFNDILLLDKLIDFVLCFCGSMGISPDCFFGIPDACTKLGVLTQYTAFKIYNDNGIKNCIPMGRSNKKTHGAPEDSFFVGAPSGNIVVIEDTVTTGDSTLKWLDFLSKNAKVNISTVISLTDRMEIRPDGRSSFEALEAHGVKYYSLCSLDYRFLDKCREFQENSN